MLGFLSKLFGGSKSQKDVKLLLPIVDKTNQFFQQYQSLSNDELRAKTVEFKERINAHLKDIDSDIENLGKEADALTVEDITGRDTIFQQVDKLKKERNTKIEEALKEIQPEAFAVVKETARRFTQNTELTAKVTELDRL
ncbi:MAG TPA: preprotein translocase subunit SecA, partial [Segetibacter sp.]